MELLFLSPKELKKSIPFAAVNKIGNLAFSVACVELMKLGTYPYLRLARDSKINTYSHLYLVPSEIEDKSAIKVKKMGPTYYIRFANIITQLDITAKRFKIVKEDYKGQNVFKLIEE